jgi:hypothetical protein
MSFRIVRQSKYRHVFGNAAKRADVSLHPLFEKALERTPCARI